MACAHAVFIFHHGDTVVMHAQIGEIHTGVFDITIDFLCRLAPLCTVISRRVLADSVFCIVAFGTAGAGFDAFFQRERESLRREYVHSGKCRDFVGFREAEEPVEDVEVMAALVNPESTAGGFLSVPARHIGASAVVEFAVFGKENLSENAFVNNAFEFQQKRRVAQIEADHGDLFAFLRFFDNVLAAFDAGGKRFVDQDIDLVLQRSDRALFVERIRGGDDDRIQFFLVEHFIKIGIDFGRSEFFRHEFCPYLIEIADRPDDAIGTLFQVVPETADSPKPCSNDAEVQFLFHDLSFIL